LQLPLGLTIILGKLLGSVDILNKPSKDSKLQR